MSRKIRYQGAILRDHHILLIKHRRHDDGLSYWVLPGGGIEADEGEEACVQREMLEETNLNVHVQRLLLDEPSVLPDGAYERLRTYVCKVISGEAHPGYEPEVEALYGISEVRWFDLRDPAGWDAQLLDDSLTFPLMQRIQAALGYQQPAAKQLRPGTIARATADHKPYYPDPLVVSVGEEVTVGREDTEWVGWLWCTSAAGKSGWVPKRYIEPASEGDKGRILVDYTAAELPVQTGEALTLHHEESGWYWATNAAGEQGWVPATHVELSS
jgi:8-oxo-dGTP pyrophosphatase MutT (NUDIX family)